MKELKELRTKYKEACETFEIYENDLTICIIKKEVKK